MLGMVEMGRKKQIFSGELLGMVEMGLKKQIFSGELLGMGGRKTRYQVTVAGAAV